MGARVIRGHVRRLSHLAPKPLFFAAQSGLEAPGVACKLNPTLVRPPSIAWQIDVARIEWAFIEAFDSGERDPLTLEQIATLDADSRLALQPHVQLVALDYPVDDLVLALHHTRKGKPAKPE